MKVEYVTHYGDDLSPVNAARVSFDRTSNFIGSADLKIAGMYVEAKEKKNEVDEAFIAYANEAPDLINEGSFLSRGDYGLIHHLAKHKHTSCFEHQGATLRLKVPIFIARQIQRHRTFSYNEISRRYVDSAPEFFWPDKWRKRADNVKQGSSDEAVRWINDGHSSITARAEAFEEGVTKLYNDMLEGGVAPELARMILPQNMYTEFYMTGNLRNWAHFLKLRLDGHAQKEVQDVANGVLEIVKPLFPVSVEALMKYD